MWKNILFLLCTALVLTTPTFAQSFDQTNVDASACIVMEMESGRVLAGQNIHQRLPMASTTKIMTTMLALEQQNLDEYFVVDSTAIQVEGSSMGLVEGDQASLRMLCYGMMLPSGNDAANATAVRIAGSLDKFVVMMNERAEELELENTHYVTVCGLDADEHYSSAYDLAKLTSVAMENPIFQEICKLDSAQVSFGNPPYERWLKNYNKLISRYPECIGVKTGFTDNAKRCLVSAARRGDVTLICVTLNAPDDWNIHQNLYETYLSAYTMTSLNDLIPQASASVKVAGALESDLPDGETLSLLPAHEISYPVKEGEKAKLTCKILAEPMVYAPVKQGDVLGQAQFYLNGEEVSSVPLLAAQAVSEKYPGGKKNFVDRLSDFALQLKESIENMFD